MKGNVWIREVPAAGESDAKPWTLKTDEAFVEGATREVRAQGYVQLEDGKTVVYGDEGVFDLSAHTGRMEEVATGFAPWRIQAKQARFSPGRVRFKHARLTSCSFDPEPHYRIWAHSARIRPGRSLVATHAVFFLGDVPFLYTPFLYKSLSEKHWLNTRLAPGYDKRNGLYAKTHTLFGFSPSLYGKLFLDYYELKGLGTGAELDFLDASSTGPDRGTLYGYRLREKSTGSERWAVLGNHYQTLPMPGPVSFQGRLQAQSDPTFMNDYSRTNAFRIVQELVNSAALLHQTPWTSTRLSYSRVDQAENLAGLMPGERGRFVKTNESLPRLDFNTASFSLLRLPVLHTVSAFADNQYDAQGPLQKLAGFGWTFALPTVKLRRGATFVPQAGYQQTYQDNLRTGVSGFVGRYNTSGTLGVWTPLGDLRLAHAFQRRLNTEAADKGVESNLLTLSDTLRPDRRVFMRLVTGYDFRTFRDGASNLQAFGDAAPTFQDRLLPLTADLVYVPKLGVNLAVRNDYHFIQGHRSSILQLDLGDRQATFFGLGLQHNAANKEHYWVSQEFGYQPKSASWTVGGALRADLFRQNVDGYRKSHLFEKELVLSKNFHDFHVRVLGRARPGGVKETQILLELLFSAERDDGILKKDLEGEFYPWRQGNPALVE